MVIPDMEGGSPVKKRLKLSLKASRQKLPSPPTARNDKAADAAGQRDTSPRKLASDSTETLIYTDPSASSSVTETSSNCTTDTSGSNVTQTSSSRETHTSDSSVSQSTGSGETETSSSSVTASVSDDSTRDDGRVPAVASLENFGNTCFLNSILQVLRYTPTFLDNLAVLYNDIQLSERIKRRQKTSDNADVPLSFEEESTKHCWKVVKSVYKVYRDLTLLEDKYEEVASNDVMSMAVKPIKVLQAVRDLNPMFMGHLQHDAQEFLHCFLAYIQDAEKAVQKFYCEMPNRFSPKPVKVNPIMQTFLNAAKPKVPIPLTETNLDVEKKTDVEMVKVNLFSGSDKEGMAAKSPSKMEIVPRLADTANIVENIAEKTSLPMSVSSVVAETESIGDVAAGKDSFEDVIPSRKVRGRKKGSTKKVSHPYDSPKIRANRKLKKGGKNDNNNVDCDSGELQDKKQPLIMNVFANTYAKKKRLGMSGAVVKKNPEDDSEKTNQSMDNSETVSGDKLVNDECKAKKNVNSESNVLESGAKVKSEVVSSCKPIMQSLSDSSLANLKDPYVRLNRAVDKQSKSFHDVFKEFASADSASTMSDDSSDSDTNIVKEKKLAKLKYESPRRSPRKLNSVTIQSLGLSGSKSASCQMSHTGSAVNAVKSKLCFSPSKALTSSNSTPSVSGELTASHEPTSSVTPDLSNLKSNIKVEGEGISPVAKNNSLWPVVKLEKCDYVFENNRTSVSAAYATQRMTPVKRSQRCPSSHNYLKERQAESLEDSEALQRAIEEMLNSPVKSRSKFDLIERRFQGTMILRTRCLQCESSKERQEAFHDINIPVRLEKVDSDDEDDTTGGRESPCSLLDLIEASTEVERLLEDNKYFCDECQCYVEAERSIHYDTMPDMLTLHLKRFCADAGNPGYMTKINDHVDIPLDLPCLRYKCPQTCLRPDHKYKLYGIVTHSGGSITSGHYLSYVKALVNRPQKSDSQSSLQNGGSISQGANKDTSDAASKKATIGKSVRQKKLPSRFDDSVMVDTKVKAFEAAVTKPGKPDVQEALMTCGQFETEWFECDDETVRVFEPSDFKELLSAEGSNTLLGTPYLLFYHKATLS